MSLTRQQTLKTVGTIDRQTRRELILTRLREAISEGQLTPGTHLAEIELSEALGVSRGTLREALRHLQQEGLLDSDSRGRLSVHRVNGAEVEEIFALRAALESLAVEAICAREDRSTEVAALRARLDALADTTGNFVAQINADLAFHEELCTQSGNGTLLRAWRNVSGLARGAITAAGAETALHNMAHARHLPLVDHIEAGDAAAGTAFLRQHMADASAALIERLGSAETPED